MARRKFRRAGFNTKLIMDVGLAGIATRILPMVVNKFMPLDPTLYAVVGAGGTYVVGSMLKKPDLANAGIALGLVEFVAPMVENLIGGIVGTPAVNVAPGVKPLPPMKIQPKVALDDYLSLNDYIPMPDVRQSIDQYRSSY
jgi:hypothetical protein